MKNWKLIISVSLTISLLYACGNTEKNSEEPKKTEAFTTESSTSGNNSKDQKEEVTTIAGQKMTDIEQQKIADFVAKYPIAHAKAIETGDFTPLANEYIMHDTILYENLLAEVKKQHEAGTTEQVNKIVISKINRLSDTDFTVNTKESIEENQNDSKKTIERQRQYTLYYDYVEGDDSNSFFKITDMKDIK